MTLIGLCQTPTKTALPSLCGQESAAQTIKTSYLKPSKVLAGQNVEFFWCRGSQGGAVAAALYQPADAAAKGLGQASMPSGHHVIHSRASSRTSSTSSSTGNPGSAGNNS